MAPPGSSAKMVASPALAGSLPMAMPPSLTKVLRLEVAGLADADHQPAARPSVPRGTISSSAEPLLPVKRSALAARATRSAAGAERLAGRRPEFEAVVAEHDQNALFGNGERTKFELEGARHENLGRLIATSVSYAARAHLVQSKYLDRTLQIEQSAAICGLSRLFELSTVCYRRA